MKLNKLFLVLCLLTAIIISASGVSAAGNSKTDVPLTDAGERFLSQYSNMLKALQGEIVNTVPRIDNNNSYAGSIPAYVDKFLSSNKLDAKLIKCAVLYNATPRGLAQFAQQGKSEQALIEKLLADDDLMKQMLVGGGAKWGNYGRAIQIYTDIQKASKRADKGIFQRLALGTSLEHAGGVLGFDVATFIDPVKRYLSYEKAYLQGDLDPGFKDLGVWEFRYVTNSNALDEELEWGRQMLRNYRPDHMLRTDKLLYFMIVKTDVVYMTPNWTSRPKTYQQLICGGGKCGPQAWFGRFIVRAYGIPVWGVQQDGHAALGRWTPRGWMTNFGRPWQYNWWEGLCGTSFYLDSQARAFPKKYMKALRAEWVADALGQQKADGMVPGSGGSWNVLAYHQRKAIASSRRYDQRNPAAAETGDERIVTKLEKFRRVEISKSDKEISVGSDGTIKIPAVACSKPNTSSNSIIFMKSFSGGMQMHHSRTVEEKGKNNTEGYDPDFEYTFNVPKAGKYALTANVVTVNKDQQLIVTPNNAANSVEIAVPYTTGMWGQTDPVEIKLVRGRNKLHFTRIRPYYGLSIKDFTLTPVK